MINRALIKERAKGLFLNNYWPCVGIFVLIALLGGVGSGGAGAGYNIGGLFRDNGGSSVGYQDIFSYVPRAFLIAMALITVFAGIAAIAVSVFVSMPMQVSSSKVSVGIYDGGKPAFGDVFYCFKGGRYMKHVGTMLLNNLFISIPMLVLAIPVMIISLVMAFRTPALAVMIQNGAFSTGIPGEMLGVAIGLLVMTLLMIPAGIVTIILSYGLFLTPYLAADRGIYGMEAIKTSWRLMKGRKGELFVFGLSFIGWDLLTALTVGLLGVFFTVPYQQVSYAGFYRSVAGMPEIEAETPEAAPAEC